MCERCRKLEEVVDKPKRKAPKEEYRREIARRKRQWFIKTIAAVSFAVILYEFKNCEPRHPKEEVRGSRTPELGSREGREYIRRVMEHEAWRHGRDRAAERAFKNAAKTAPERRDVLEFLRKIPINGAAMSAADDIELRQREREIVEQIASRITQSLREVR